ncbi:MAG: hypothetical protein IIA45_13360, partial [Bacteroidetes bacterium]|nr:hypothetical protein [Bacteroidota bacterium]
SVGDILYKLSSNYQDHGIYLNVGITRSIDFFGRRFLKVRRNGIPFINIE